MLQRVREGLLHDPVRGQVDTWRKRSELTLDRDRHRQPGVAHPFHEVVKLLQAGMWLEVVIIRLVHEQVQQPAQLFEAGTARRVDGLQGPASRRGIGVEYAIGGLCLQHDHRQAVRDEIVQLPGDPARS